MWQNEWYAKANQDTVMKLIGDRCRSITFLKLHGPFLCTPDAYTSLFQSLENLTHFNLSHGSKFNDVAVYSLVENTTGLVELHLDETPKVVSDGVKCMEQLKSLNKLSLDRIGNVECDILCNLIESIGSNLNHLSLIRFYPSNSVTLPSQIKFMNQLHPIAQVSHPSHSKNALYSPPNPFPRHSPSFRRYHILTSPRIYRTMHSFPLLFRIIRNCYH